MGAHDRYAMGAFFAFACAIVVRVAPALAAQTQLWDARSEKNFGRIVAVLGDVDGDGAADVAGARGSIFGPSSEPLEVRSGLDGSILALLPSWNGSIWQVFAETLCGVGDTDADGVPDVLAGVGVGGVPKPGWAHGRARLLSAATGWALAEVSAPSPYDEDFGSRIGAAGDVTGDGRADVLVGNAYPGLVRVLEGPSGTLRFEHAPEGAVIAVAGGSDFDLDGISDYLIAREGGTTEYSGRTGAPIATFPAVPTHAVLVPDADGAPDLAAGTQIGTYPLGQPGGSVRIYSSATGAALATLVDGEPDHWFGSTLSPGDLNGDGLVDLAVGAPGVPGYWSPGKASVQAFSFAPGLAQYGIGTADCAGVHFLNTNEAPVVGAAGVGLACTAAPPLAQGLLLLVDPFASQELLAFDMPSNPSGLGRASAPIPNDPALVGRHDHAQAIWSWAGGCAPSPLGLSSSLGLSIEILAP